MKIRGLSAIVDGILDGPKVLWHKWGTSGRGEENLEGHGAERINPQTYQYWANLRREEAYSSSLVSSAIAGGMAMTFAAVSSVVGIYSLIYEIALR